ncbi:hypothetical protein KP509_1Z056500 [Ceratopteris richardii]|nr:hypothetical protein KP509_1Z056500 [Ceratopteris richardii]
MHRSRTMPTLDLVLQLPPHFRCPISLDLMTDPVTLSSGHTYDRSSIERWIADGNTTCPVTMQKLDNVALIPNHTLRRLIQEWCAANASSTLPRIPTPKQPADLHSIRSLVNDAASLSPQDSAQAVRALRITADGGEKNRAIMAEAGAAAVLLELVFSGDFEDRSAMGYTESAYGGERERFCSELAEEALAAVAFVPLRDAERLRAASPRRLEFLAALLQHGRGDVRLHAGALLAALSDSDALHEIRDALVSREGVMEGFLELLLHMPGSATARKMCIIGIHHLCLRKQGRERAAELGAITVLLEQLPCADIDDAERALAAIELMSTTDHGCRRIASHAMAIPVLVKSILEVPTQATEHAAAILLNICMFSSEAQKEAVKAGIVVKLLLLIQSNCTHVGKAKSMALLRLLRAPRHSSSMQKNGRIRLPPSELDETFGFAL